MQTRYLGSLLPAILLAGPGLAQPMRAPLPAQPPVTWIKSADQFGKGIAVNAEVLFRLEIDALGKVTGCSAKTDVVAAVPLENKLCTLMSARAAFTPARGPDGNPIAGIYNGSIHLRARKEELFVQPGANIGIAVVMPDFFRPPTYSDLNFADAAIPDGWSSPLFLQADVLVGVDGSARDCLVRPLNEHMENLRVRQNRGSLEPLGSAGCRLALSGWKTLPAKAADGAAVAAVQTVTFAFHAGDGKTALPPPEMRTLPDFPTKVRAIAKSGILVNYNPNGAAPLYFNEADPIGKSNCRNSCSFERVPLLVQPGDMPIGKWTVVSQGLRKQWAFEGRPVYICAQDIDRRSLTGDCDGGSWHVLRIPRG